MQCDTNMLTKARLLLISGIALMGGSPALAQSGGFGDIATNFRTDTMGPVADLLGSAAFVIGLIVAMMGIWMLVQSRRNAHDPNSSVGRALLLFFAAACLIGIPAFLGAGVTTFFGSGAEKTSVDGSLRSIN